MGPSSQSAQTRYFIESLVCENPTFSKVNMSATVQYSLRGSVSFAAAAGLGRSNYKMVIGVIFSYGANGDFLPAGQ